MEKAKRECMQMEPAFDFPGHGDGPQNPFLRPNNNPFEKLTRGGDFSDLQSLWRTKRDASEGLVDVEISQTCSPCGEQRETPARVLSMWTRMTSMSTSSRSTTTDTTSRTPWAT